MTSGRSAPGAQVAPGLRALAERLWIPGGDAAAPVRVGYGTPAPGTNTVEEYVVVPSLAKPRLMVPVKAHAASRAAFGRHLATSSWRTRARSAGLMAAFGGPVGERIMGDRLYVGVDAAIDPTEWPTWNLLSYLQQSLRADDLVAFIQLRRVTPNAKPTLRLFERSGRPVGFAKVGWSDATKVVVRNEGETLAAVQDRLRVLHVPRLADAGVWQGQDYVVAAPLPGGVGRFTQEPSTMPELMLDIVQAGQTSRAPLGSSGYAQQIRTVLDQAAATETEPSEVLLAWLDRLTTRTDELAYGRWHGDFVPWNLGRTRSGVVAWDWEYSEADVPIGFDLVHWHFQRSIAAPDGTLAEAVRAADAASDRLVALGVDQHSTSLVASLYLLTMFTRAVRLAAGGAGWNPKFYPDFVDLARERDR